MCGEFPLVTELGLIVIIFSIVIYLFATRGK